MRKAELISRVEVQSLAYATEDLNKVKEAIMNLVPLTFRSLFKISIEKVRGHYGDPIFILRSTIDDPNFIKEFIRHISSNLSEESKYYLLANLPLYTDERSLYLRFDKQAAFLKKFKLKTEDPIKITIRLSEARDAKSIEELFGSLLLGSGKEI